MPEPPALSENPSASASSPPRSGRIVRLLLWFVLLSGAGLYLFARTRMNPAVSLLVGGHILGGLAMLAMLRRVLFAWDDDEAAPTTPPTALYGCQMQGGPLLIVLASLSGGWLILLAVFGHSVGQARGAFLFHVIIGLLLLFLAVERFLRQARNLPERSLAFMRRSARAGAAAGLFLLSGGALAGYTSYTYAADAYFHNLTATDVRQAGSTFFPAGTRTVDGKPLRSLPSAASCGVAGCHADIVAQWQASGHARAEQNSVYQAALQEAEKAFGTNGTRWCAGCHSPGQVAALGATPLECLSCHAMADVPEQTGNGRAVYAAPPSYPFADSSPSASPWLHGFFLRVRPEPHRVGLHGPASQTAPEAPGTRDTGRAGMCAPCHRLSVNVPQNHYKFLRYEDTWGDWQTSSYSGASAHVFASASRPRDCVDCHFRPSTPTQKQMSGHACPGGTELSPEERKKAFRVEFIALKEDGVGGRLQTPLTAASVRLTPGNTVLLDVLVETRGIGHAFPTGSPDLRQAWLEVRAARENGRVERRESRAEREVNGSGDALPNAQRLTPNAPSLSTHDSRLSTHPYGLLALDRQGRPLAGGNLYDMVAPVYSRTLGADVGDVARYRLTVPKEGTGSLFLTARLRYRPLPDGFEKKAEPIAPITLAEQTLVLAIGDSASSNAQRPAPNAQRLFAYGIALLTQEDRARAREVLLEAVRLAPRQPEYLVALGRVYLADGDLLSAQAQFRSALSLAPDLPQARAWLGATYRKMGQFEAALKELNSLRTQFPHDRLLWLDIGGCQLQNAQYEEAVRSFQQLLSIDPDDATAHFNLVQCYVALRRLADARKEEAIFRALQDDPLTEIREPYLRTHPEARREELKMHEHPLEVATAPK